MSLTLTAKRRTEEGGSGSAGPDLMSGSSPESLQSLCGNCCISQEDDLNMDMPTWLDLLMLNLKGTQTKLSPHVVLSDL